MGRGRRRKEREEEREREREGGSIDLVARMKREAESEAGGYSQARPLVSINYRPPPYKAIIKSREHVVLHTRVSVTSDLRVTHGEIRDDVDPVLHQDASVRISLRQIFRSRILSSRLRVNSDPLERRIGSVFYQILRVVQFLNLNVSLDS